MLFQGLANRQHDERLLIWVPKRWAAEPPSVQLTATSLFSLPLNLSSQLGAGLHPRRDQKPIT